MDYIIYIENADTNDLGQPSVAVRECLFRDTLDPAVFNLSTLRFKGMNYSLQYSHDHVTPCCSDTANIDMCPAQNIVCRHSVRADTLS